MKLNHKKLISALLALSLALMTACGSTPPSSQSSTPADSVAMGRYVEQSCTLPEGVELVTALQLRDDGNLQLLGYQKASKAIGLYTLTDGNKWEQQRNLQLEASGLNEYSVAFEKPDGTLVVAGFYYSEEFLAQMDQSGGYSEDIEWPKLQFVEIAPDGTKRDIPIVMPGKAAGNVSKLIVAPDGDIFALSYTEVYQFDGDTGALKTTYSLDETCTSIALNEDRLVAMQSSTALIFDTATGDRVETVDQLGIAVTDLDNLNVSSSGWEETSVVAVGGDGAFYFCNSTGIYRRTGDGELIERILDGSLVTLGVPSLAIMDMVVKDESIFVSLRSFNTDTSTVKQYTFDPSVPTLPSKELRVYSLAENKTVRQSISNYQLQDPDTHVVLEVAPAELSTSDALRTLNTRLLAGDGPDILVLDGMPIDAYMQEKVLLPLDDSAATGMLPNIKEASRSSDGKIYVLPARFAVPAMTGQAATLAQVRDITTLAEQLSALKVAKPDTRMTLQNCGGDVLLNTFYPIYAQQLYTDGKPDEARLRTFLQALGQIAGLQTGEAFVTDETAEAVLHIVWNSINWALGGELMGMGYIDSAESISVSDSAANKVEGGAVLPLSLTGSHSYIPSTMLGVLSNSQNQESAMKFIALALSTEVQQLDFKDGLPVNEQALTKLLSPRSEKDRSMGAYGSTNAEGVTSVVQSNFPEAAQLTVIRGWIDALDTPAVAERAALELLRTETAGYFEGSKTLDETVQVLMQKLLLLGSE